MVRSRTTVQLVCAAALIAALLPAVGPTQAMADSPTLKFVSQANFPIGFIAEGGEVTAALAGFDTVVHCTGSSGTGEITGPRFTASNWIFTGCETQTGSEAGRKCQSAGANEKEIRTGRIGADLVYLDQARHEVGMLLNPDAGVYMEFECGSEPVKGRGSFLSPVGPVNSEATSFTATLSRVGATQVPGQYEGLNGERLQAVPIGERGSLPAATTGVELGFTIHPSAPLSIRAVSAEEVEAQRREAEAAAAKKRQEEEATVKRRQEEEAAQRREEKERARAKRRAQHLTKALKQCRKVKSGRKHARCVRRAKKKFGAHRASSILSV